MTSEYLLKAIRDDFDRAVVAHDHTDPRHRSHGGQHTNGRCCAFGNLNPSAVIAIRRWRDDIDRHLNDLKTGLGGHTNADMPRVPCMHGDTSGVCASCRNGGW